MNVSFYSDFILQVIAKIILMLYNTHKHTINVYHSYLSFGFNVRM